MVHFQIKKCTFVEHFLQISFLDFHHNKDVVKRVGGVQIDIRNNDVKYFGSEAVILNLGELTLYLYFAYPLFCIVPVNKGRPH